VQGELAETREKLKTSEAAAELGVTVAPAPGETLPEAEPDLYRAGYDKYKAQDWEGAVRVFSAYTNKFPGAPQADNAFYLMAEALTQREDFPASIRVLQVVLQKYSSGDKVDDAHVLMHDNFVAMKRCKDAMPFLETLIADFPSSSRVADAKKKLAATKRTCR
jgi:TolA-binding protein